MKTIIYRLKNSFHFGLVVQEDNINEAIMIAPMKLSDEVGSTWWIDKMPSLQFVEGDLLKIKNDMIVTEILVIWKKYLESGCLRYFTGMKRIYFITEIMGAYSEFFHIPLFERAHPPFHLPPIPAILQVHIDFCSIIDGFHSAMINSGGNTVISSNVLVSIETANSFITAFPSDDIMTIVKPLNINKKERILHNLSFIDNLKCKRFGWKIISILPLEVIRELLGSNSTWVYLFIMIIFLSNHMCI